jgi:hypothetical protein
MQNRPNRRTSIKTSSSNVFSDLGLTAAIELDTKLRLAAYINGLIAANGVPLRSMATRLVTMGRSISYRLESFSLTSLMNLQLAHGQDVGTRIVPRQRQPRRLDKATCLHIQ